MTALYFSPIWNGTQFFDNNGNVLAGGQIYTYVGGSYTVESATWNTPSGSVQNSNPIILNGNGRPSTEIWLLPGQYYNFVLLDAYGNQLQACDNIQGVEPSSINGGGSNVNLWNSVANPVYVNSTNFYVPGNYTSQFFVGNRVQFINGATVGYGTVSAVSFSGGNTYVTLINDSLALGSNLNTVSWSALIVNGRTVDAAGVSYTSALSYSTASIGGQVQTLNSEVSTLISENSTQQQQLVDRNTVYVASGTYASGGTAFTLSPNPAATSLTGNATYDVYFDADGGAAPTLNISGLGAHTLVTYNSAGTPVNPVIVTGQVSRVCYDGYYVLQNPLPAAAPVIPTASCYFSQEQTTAVNGDLIGYGNAFITAVGINSFDGYTVHVTNAGVYKIHCSTSWASNNNTAYLSLKHNGVVTAQAGMFIAAGASVPCVVDVILYLNANDNLSVFWGNSSGTGAGGSTCGNSGTFNFFRIA